MADYDHELHRPNGDKGICRIMMWLILGEANKREGREVEVWMCWM